MQHNATYEKATDGKDIRLSTAGMPLTSGENIRASMCFARAALEKK